MYYSGLLFFSLLFAHAAPLSLKAVKNDPQLLEYFSQSQRFVRGEIQSQELQRDLLKILDGHLKKAEKEAQKQKWSEFKQYIHPWVIFAADLVYEEGSSTAIHFSHQLRRKIMDELQTKKYPSQWDANHWESWISQWPLPWPVDRLVLHQARQKLVLSQEPQLQKLIAEIKKNPYQSIEACARGLFGAKGAEPFRAIFPAWTEREVQLMKSEFNQYQQLKKGKR